MREIAQVIAVALSDRFESEREALGERTRSLMERYPLYPAAVGLAGGRLSYCDDAAPDAGVLERRRAAARVAVAERERVRARRSPARTRGSRPRIGLATPPTSPGPGPCSGSAGPALLNVMIDGPLGSSVGSNRCTWAAALLPPPLTWPVTRA